MPEYVINLCYYRKIFSLMTSKKKWSNLEASNVSFHSSCTAVVLSLGVDNLIFT